MEAEEISIEIILQISSSHQSRLSRSLEERFGCAIGSLTAIKDSDSFVTIQKAPSDLSAFLDGLYRCFIGRHVNRVYVCHKKLPHSEMIRSICSESKGKILRIQAFPKTMERKLGEDLPLEVQLHPKNYTHVLCVVAVPGEQAYRFGIIPKDQHFSQHADAVSSAEKEALAGSEAISRAYFKLAELLERTAVPLKGVAVDVGASPGGWTQFLVSQPNISAVVAIDPAPLALDPMPSKAVYLSMKAEEALNGPLQKYAPVSVLVCDMNIDPRASADICLQFLPVLQPGALLILTIKFTKGYSSRKAREDQQNETMARVQTAFENIRLLWLLANGNERTLLATRKQIT